MSARLSRRTIFAAMIALAATPVARAFPSAGLWGRPIDLRFGEARVPGKLIAAFDFSPPPARMYDLQEEDFLTEAEAAVPAFTGSRQYRFTLRRYAVSELSPLVPVRRL